MKIKQSLEGIETNTRLLGELVESVKSVDAKLGSMVEVLQEIASLLKNVKEEFDGR